MRFGAMRKSAISLFASQVSGGSIRSSTSAYGRSASMPVSGQSQTSSFPPKRPFIAEDTFIERLKDIGKLIFRINSPSKKYRGR